MLRHAAFLVSVSARFRAAALGWTGFYPQDRSEFSSAIERLYRGRNAVRIDYRYYSGVRAEPMNVTELMSL